MQKICNDISATVVKSLIMMLSFCKMAQEVHIKMDRIIECQWNQPYGPRY